MEIVVIAHNIRSIHNVGAIFRNCDGFGVAKLYLTGYSPAPGKGLPHVAKKLSDAITKTALGAEQSVPHEYRENVVDLIAKLRDEGFAIVGLEQDERSIILPNYKPPAKIALLLGEEVEGIENSLRKLCDDLIEIPMFGAKESFNVSVATGIALYGLRNSSAI